MQHVAQKKITVPMASRIANTTLSTKYRKNARGLARTSTHTVRKAAEHGMRRRY